MQPAGGVGDQDFDAASLCRLQAVECDRGGIGERPEDLRVFDAEAFVDALLPESLGAT
jgi:fused signal recognition particle receptor